MADGISDAREARWALADGTHGLLVTHNALATTLGQLGRRAVVGRCRSRHVARGAVPHGLVTLATSNRRHEQQEHGEGLINAPHVSHAVTVPWREERSSESWATARVAPLGARAQVADTIDGVLTIADDPRVFVSEELTGVTYPLDVA